VDRSGGDRLTPRLPREPGSLGRHRHVERLSCDGCANRAQREWSAGWRADHRRLSGGPHAVRLRRAGRARIRRLHPVSEPLRVANQLASNSRGLRPPDVESTNLAVRPGSHESLLTALLSHPPGVRERVLLPQTRPSCSPVEAAGSSVLLDLTRGVIETNSLRTRGEGALRRVVSQFDQRRSVRRGRWTGAGVK